MDETSWDILTKTLSLEQREAFSRLFLECQGRGWDRLELEFRGHRLVGFHIHQSLLAPKDTLAANERNCATIE